MFQLLAVVTVLPVMMFIIILAVFVFYVFPKIKNSKRIEKLADDMTSDGRDKTATSAVIETITKAKDKLADKQESITQTIKDAKAESKSISEVLNPTDDE